MIKRWAVFIILLCIGTVPFWGFSYPHQAEKAEAAAAVKRYYQYLSDGEIEQAIGMLSPQCSVFLPGGGDLVNLDEMKNRLASNSNDIPGKFDVQFEGGVRIEGDAAIVTYRLRSQYKQMDQSMIVESMVTSVLEKQNGQWIILHQHYT